MVEQWIKQLKHSDATKRREAIMALGKSADARALPHLAQVYKNDPSPELRDLAAKAGRYIQQQSKQGAPATPAAPPPSAVVEPPDEVYDDIDLDLLDSLDRDDGRIYIEPEPETPLVMESKESALPDILAAYRKKPDAAPAKPAAPPPAEVRVSPTPSAASDDAPSNLPSILSAYTKKPSEAPPVSSPPAASNKAVVPATTAPAKAPAKELKTSPAEITIKELKQATKAQQEKAQDKLRSAFSYKMNGNDQSALADLARALTLDPNLKNDQAASGLAQSLTGGAGPEAIALVMQKANRGEAKHDTKERYDRGLNDLILSLVVYFVVIVIFSLAVYYGSLIIQSAVETFGKTTEAGVTPEQAKIVKSLLNNLSLQNILPIVAKNGFITLMATFFQGMIIYAAGTFMGGTGDFVRFARMFVNVNTGIYILLAAGFGALIYGIFSGSDDTLTTMFAIGAGCILIAILGGNFILAIFASRVQKMSFIIALISVFVGITAAGFLANALGLFRSLSS